MNTKKIAWHTVAVAAAALFSTGAHADPRREQGFSSQSRSFGNRHHRVWNERGHAGYGRFDFLASPNK